MNEPRFTIFEGFPAPTFEIKGMSHVYNYKDLTQWLEERFGPDGAVYRILPFHVRFFRGHYDEAMEFRLRWC